jgi:hypothetical protein
MATREELADTGWARLAIAWTSVELRCDEFFSPDLGIPTDYQGPRFVVVAFGERVALQCGTCPGAIVAVAPAEAAAIVTAAHEAFKAPRVRQGADTAVGRTITALRLRIDDPRGERLLSDARVNHYGSRVLSPAWSYFLRVVRDACGPLSEQLEQAWSYALRWAAPMELGALWDAGQVVALPHWWTSFVVTGAAYLRTGQAQATSQLYRIDPASPRLEQLVNGRAIDVPIRHASPTMLPCRAAEVVIRTTWQSDPVLEVRVLDGERWAYVQRA